jgi:hypothetical protein
VIRGSNREGQSRRGRRDEKLRLLFAVLLGWSFADEPTGGGLSASGFIVSLTWNPSRI